MSATSRDSAESTEAGSATAEALLPLFVVAAVYLLMLAVGANLLNDPDSYWHLASARLIYWLGFPTTDPFSFTFAGTPWIAKEWLSQIVFLGAYMAAGWSGMVILSAAAIALAMGLLARFLQARLSALYTIAFVAVAFMLVTPHALARPHILIAPVLVAWVAAMLRANESGRTPSLWLLPLVMLWANLHSSFLIGLVLVAAIGLDALVSAPVSERRRLFVGWLGFGLLALAATCITPYGPGSLLAAVRVLGVGSALSLIGEWRPADFSQLNALTITLIGGLAAALLSGVRLPPLRAITVAALVYLALTAERNAEILGLVAPMLLAAPLARQFPSIAGQGAHERLPVMAGAVVLAALVPLTVGLVAIGNYQPNPRVTPAGAVAALEASGSKRVLNDYDFGGYLVSKGVPTFIDGRTELYGAAFFRRYHDAATLTDIPALTAIIADYDIDATIFAPTTPVATFLDTLPGWRRLYSDDVAVVHVRTPTTP